MLMLKFRLNWVFVHPYYCKYKSSYETDCRDISEWLKRFNYSVCLFNQIIILCLIVLLI